jgi:hypothetical protein
MPAQGLRFCGASLCHRAPRRAYGFVLHRARGTDAELICRIQYDKRAGFPSGGSGLLRFARNDEIKSSLRGAEGDEAIQKPADAAI